LKLQVARRITSVAGVGGAQVRVAQRARASAWSCPRAASSPTRWPCPWPLGAAVALAESLGEGVLLTVRLLLAPRLRLCVAPGEFVAVSVAPGEAEPLGVGEAVDVPEGEALGVGGAGVPLGVAMAGEAVFEGVREPLSVVKGVRLRLADVLVLPPGVSEGVGEGVVVGQRDTEALPVMEPVAVAVALMVPVAVGVGEGLAVGDAVSDTVPVLLKSRSARATRLAWARATAWFSRSRSRWACRWACSWGWASPCPSRWPWACRWRCAAQSG
jgi:hypothetical protein